MASYNKVILMGNLTRDPEVKHLQSGTTVANFGVAINENYTDSQTGEPKENTCFVEVEAWGRQAEIVGEHFTKGRPIFIEGALKYESWTTEDGTKRNRLKVRLIRFQFVGSRPQNAGEGDATPTLQETETPAPAATGDGDLGDDIPF